MPRANHDAPGLAEARDERRARREQARPSDGPAPTAGPSAAAPSSAAAPKLTPAMQQHDRFKRAHPGCVLFFRMGDFYELFGEDAETAHRALGITLTARNGGTPMAGVPHHALEGYLRRLIEQGHRVAVADQVQDPKDAKGVVDRAVTRVLTPGTLVDDALLDEGRTNLVAAVVLHPVPGDGGPSRGGVRPPASATSTAPAAGLAAGPEPLVTVAAAEVSTGRFLLLTVPVARLGDELARLGPSEVIHADDDEADGPPPALADATAGSDISLGRRPPWTFRPEEAARVLEEHYGVATLVGFGLTAGSPEVAAAGALVRYLLDTQAPDAARTGRRALTHLDPPRRTDPARGMVLDRASLASLEIERTMRSGSTDGSLLATVRRCVTPMGKRLLRDWLCYPLADRPAIEARQAVVAALVADDRLRRELTATLRPVQDVARIAGRVAIGRATPRDLVALGTSAERGAALRENLQGTPALAGPAARLEAVRRELDPLAADIGARCVPEPPAHLRDGGLFQDGIDPELDAARTLRRDAAGWLARYQASLSETSGIPSLKVGYNKVFGYYLEVTHAHTDAVPESWHRKQTLKNCERYITPELKTFEEEASTAESRSVAREQALFAELCAQVQAAAATLSAYAALVAELDVLLGFADLAVRRGWCRPEITDDPGLEIVGGRHPVLDERLGDGFVPNDCRLGVPADGAAADANDEAAEARLALVTGPNMAGKSTFIRQVALITLLAHCGSWVPADRARIGLTDRIFTRIGASDELHAGQSTFMVEMVETASILHHATDRSLVVLDEIGRGTSTLDGLALAWSIAETLEARGARTLFATHYHELTDLADVLPGVTNLHVTVREWEGDVIFLHRIAPGRAGQSYGLHVARIAGVPAATVARAGEVLRSLVVQAQVPAAAGGDGQFGLFGGVRTATGADGASAAGAGAHDDERDPTPGPGRSSVPAPAAIDPAAADLLHELAALELDRLTPLDAFDRLRDLRERAAAAADPADRA